MHQKRNKSSPNLAYGNGSILDCKLTQKHPCVVDKASVRKQQNRTEQTVPVNYDSSDTTGVFDGKWCDSYIFQHTKVSTFYHIAEGGIFILLPIH
jgi:hypothetical protein